MAASHSSSNMRHQCGGVRKPKPAIKLSVIEQHIYIYGYIRIYIYYIWVYKETILMPFLLSLPLTYFKREKEEEKALHHITAETLTLHRFMHNLNLVY